MEALQQQAGLMSSMMQGMSAMLERMTKQGAGQEESAKKSSFEKLDENIFEKVKKCTGGEEEWIEWSEEFRMFVDMSSPKLANLMKHAEIHGEMEVEQAVREILGGADLAEEYVDMARLSHELY